MAISLEKKNEVLVLRNSNKKKVSLPQTVQAYSQVKVKRETGGAKDQRSKQGTLYSHTCSKGAILVPQECPKETRVPPSPSALYVPVTLEQKRGGPGVGEARLTHRPYDCRLTVPTLAVRTGACNNAFSSLNTKGN